VRVIAEFQRRCDVVEESYEFMLAFAAQGLTGSEGSPSGGQLREHLTRAADALSGLGTLLAPIIDSPPLEPALTFHAYQAVVDRDARDALAAVQLVLAQPTISSQLVDNLNASIHLRAPLTALFLIDEIFKGRGSG